MSYLGTLCVSIALLGVAATVSGRTISSRSLRAIVEENDNAVSEPQQDTLRLVTVVMRHGERAPTDTYPNDPYVNATMEPFGWGHLTKKGRNNVYLTGEFLRERYGQFLGDSYTPDKYWLQTTDVDRTKMTGMILSAALWKPNEEQSFVPNMDWQPVSLHYWKRPEDRLLLIWNACPRLTLERLLVENSTGVKQFDESNDELYRQLADLTAWPMNGAGDVASLYGTLKAEAMMGLTLPQWTDMYFPDLMERSAAFSLSLNVFNDILRKLAGGPLVKKTVSAMLDKANGELKPDDRKMYAYVGHDSTMVNVLHAMGVWDYRDPDFGCMIMIELHEVDGLYNVQIFKKNTAETAPYPLTVPGCQTVCPLEDFASIMNSVVSRDYDEDCRVDDPDYVIPRSPPA